MSSSTPNNQPPSNDPPPGSSGVQHLIIVEMQNASFDHLFGTYPATNGNTVDGLRPGVPGYVQMDATGTSVSPFLMKELAPSPLPEGPKAYLAVMNGGQMDKYAFYNGDIAMGYYDNSTPGIGTLWGYAEKYALADNYFGSVIGEAPSNQLYMVAADDNNQPFSVQPYYGPCELSDPAAAPMTFRNVGDQLNDKGVSWAAYQEDLGNCSAYKPLHDPFQYFTSTHGHTKDYSKFSSDLASGAFPAVSFVFPNNRDDMHPGFGPITYGIDFLDNLVKQVQASSIWSSTAIVVVWDAPGGWYDHVAPKQVDSQGLNGRVPLLVISPLAKQNYVSHVQMDHVSILRFIQNNWGLGTLNSRNTQSTDISDMFR
ncbi:MAG TPA: alkaline phosphatase family protein [Terriglobales bacterium]